MLDPATGEPVRDPRTGKPRLGRVRLSLAKFGVREKLTGTSAKTLDSVYDDVSVEEMRDALAALENPASRRGG